MGYRNEIDALRHRLSVVEQERDTLRDEVEVLREARDDAEDKIRREAYLRRELSKLRKMPEQLANSEIRTRQLEAHLRELRARPAPSTPSTSKPSEHWIPVMIVVVALMMMLQTFLTIVAP